MKSLAFLALIILIPIISSCKNRQESQKADGMGTSADIGNDDMYVMENDENDEKFIQEAGSSGVMALELGKYAEQKAENPRVKNFGAMVAEDQSNTNEDLKSIAGRKKIPFRLEERHSKTMTGLQGLKQNEFDKEYMKAMVDDQEDALKKFKKESKKSKDPDVREFASRNIPVLQLHLDSAKKIRHDLK